MLTNESTLSVLKSADVVRKIYILGVLEKVYNITNKWDCF